MSNAHPNGQGSLQSPATLSGGLPCLFQLLELHLSPVYLNVRGNFLAKFSFPRQLDHSCGEHQLPLDLSFLHYFNKFWQYFRNFSDSIEPCYCIGWWKIQDILQKARWLVKEVDWWAERWEEGMCERWTSREALKTVRLRWRKNLREAFCALWVKWTGSQDSGHLPFGCKSKCPSHYSWLEIVWNFTLSAKPRSFVNRETFLLVFFNKSHILEVM